MQTQSRVRGRQVEFSLGDLSLKEQISALQHMTGDLALTGRVVDFVEFGDPPEPFAVMEVRGIKTPMLVPLSALQP